jgi:phosphotransferase system enzyme I (PtsI)
MPRAVRSTPAPRQTILHGIAASPGIAVGRAFLFDPRHVVVEARPLAEDEVEREVERFLRAIENTKKHVRKLRQQVARQVNERQAAIFDAHLLILDDPTFTQDTAELIRRDRTNAEFVFNSQVQDMLARFEKIQDEMFSARAADISDVAQRVLASLMVQERPLLSTLPEPAIVIANDLGPSDTAHMNKEKVIGFATNRGGPTSHTAIMAKALEIPAVVATPLLTQHVRSGDLVIVDGIGGVVIVRPNRATLQRYARSKEALARFEQELSKNRHLPAETLDGYSVEVAANIELPEEVPHVIDHGAQSIGLFRTEFLYINRDRLPREEELFEMYRSVIAALSPRTVIFRTLDLGGDKFAKTVPLSKELNPFLGLRAIRLCLEYPEIFRRQLRAILRASIYGHIKIMFPMVSSIEEVRAAKAMLEEVQRDFRRHRVAFNREIEVGIMIETPSAAVAADLLAREVDFFSLGSNDLIQYTLAVDRVNENVAHLYEPLHPSVLRLIQNTIDAGHRQGIWVGVCGEIAGDPTMAAILVGMGIDELSMGALRIPEIKQVIRQLRVSDVRALARELLTKASAEQVRATIAEHMVRLPLRPQPPTPFAPQSRGLTGPAAHRRGELIPT